MNELPIDFNYKAYCRYNKDLENLTEEEAIYHYLNFGKNESRPYTIIPPGFDYKEYLELNKDLNCCDEKNAISHFTHYGFQEGRPYKKNLEIEFKKEKVKENKEILGKFCNLYNCSAKSIEDDNKIKFRYICYYYLAYIKNFTLPNLKQNSKKEAVLIEFRCFPHLEFLLRNNILKLGETWSFTIICGKLNYSFINDMVKTISPMIKVIKTDYENVMPSEYSQFLTSKKFWKLLKGSKILIYQEDSIIFRNNIDNFLYYDYIGAPWPLDNNGNKSRVGNGGFSLRTKNIMEKIIEKREMNETLLNSHTIEYMKSTNSFITPEDVYFTKNMEDLNIGRLATFNIGKLFSQESIKSEKCSGGHNFWLGDENWEKKIITYNVIQFKSHFNLDLLEHRGGWKSILTNLEKSQFFHDNSKIDFFDMIEPHFLWKKDYCCLNSWAGIIHCTPKTPSYLYDLNIENLFKNSNFITSLKTCKFLITLGDYVKHYLVKKINLELELNIPIYSLYHPVISENIPQFNITNFINNSEKKLIQIGQQLRKITTIYKINAENYTKIWLTGTKDLKKMNKLLEQESLFLNYNLSSLDKSVNMYYTKSFEEYDFLLTNNIVVVNFHDAAANNTILECIVRNTPVIVNKIEGVIDYLGENYPLYFESDDQIEGLLDETKIKDAYLYLKKMDKKKFTISNFTTSLFNIVKKELLNL